MDRPIERRTVTSQIADLIEAEIRSRVWTVQLPGKRTLSQRYNVNAKTCAAALDLLEQRGWLAPAEPGCRRKIRKKIETKKRDGSKEGDKRLLILSPVKSVISSGTEELLLHKAEYLWSRQYGSVSWANADFQRIRRPGPYLDELIGRHSPDALLMYMPGENWSKEACRRLPCYQFGGPCEAGTPFSVGAFSLGNEVSRVVEYLNRLGHRRILVPLQFGSLTMRKAVIEGVKRGSAREPEFGRWEDYCPYFSENVPEVWMDYWNHAFQTLRPTAVVLFEDVHLLSFYGFCYMRGLQMPKDVSVICMDDQKLLSWCKPRPTIMRFPLQAAVAHFHQWLKGGLKPLGGKYYALEMEEGETVAPPSK